MSAKPSLDPAAILFHGDDAQPAEHDPAILFEQYKLLVQSAEAVVSRRQVVNRFFLTVNAVILGAVGYGLRGELDNRYAGAVVLIVGIAGILLAWLWYRIVHSYQQLNRGKYEVVQLMESRLPAAVFAAEWAALGRGESVHLYRPSTGTEMAIPKVFIVLYGIGCLGAIGILTGLWVP